MKADWLRFACGACDLGLMAFAGWAAWTVRVTGDRVFSPVGERVVVFLMVCGLLWGVVGFAVRIGLLIQERRRYVDVFGGAWVCVVRLVSVRRGGTR